MYDIVTYINLDTNESDQWQHWQQEKKQHFDHQVTTANICIKFKQPYAEEPIWKNPHNLPLKLSTWPVTEALHILQQCGEAPWREIETTIAMNDLRNFEN